MKEVVFLGSDHAGFEVKEKLKKYFDKNEVQYEDLGAYVIDEGDDYPDFAFKVGEAVVANPGSKGILICGSGVGMAMAANKVKGVRAAEVFDIKTAKLSREHNDANILSLSGWNIKFDKIKKITEVWLRTNFAGEERHKRRIKKIENYEHE